MLVITIVKGILLFNIPKNPQKEAIINYDFIFNIDKIKINSASFNPYNSHIIACSCSNSTIQIWSVKEPAIQKISYSYEPKHIKWRKCGNFLGFDENKLLKIYNMKGKNFIFYLDFEENFSDFAFFSNNKILIINNTETIIYEYEFNLNQKGDFPMTKKDKYKQLLKVEFEYFLPLYDYYILYLNNQINLYKNFDKSTYSHECSLSSPKIIKTSNNKIIGKIMNIEDKKNIQLIIIYNKNEKEEKDDLHINMIKESFNSIPETNSIDNSPDYINENYFINCPKCFLNFVQCLEYVYNEDTSQNRKVKKYFALTETEEILENNRNNDLISLRNYVKNELSKLELDEIENKRKKQKKKQEGPDKKKNKKEEEKIELFKSIKEEYISYLNLIIKDETNPNLLLKYLSFLKLHENELKKEGIEHETFKEELIYYSVILDKNELKRLFGETFKMEKDKTKILLSEYLQNIQNNTLDSFKKKIEGDYKERYFNQPISFETKDLIYYDINENLIYDICDNKNKEPEKLDAKKYFINEILKRNIIDDYEQPEILIPLIHFIARPAKQDKSSFFLNMIQSKTLSDDELKQKAKIYNCNISIDEKEDKILVFNNAKFSNPHNICFENITASNYQECEKYNYKYLTNNQPLKLDINKIKKHLLFTLKSKVFKEAYEYLTGKNNYETLFSDDIISEYINKIMFLPVDFSNAVAFHDSLSLTTVVSTMKKKIKTNFFNIDEQISFILENGVIVAIIYHEFGHAMNAIISFSENALILNETPRKKYINFKEGGYYMEIALFGRVIQNFSLGEALYVLNKKNYNKPLAEFRKGFMELTNQDLRIEGEFKDFGLKNENKINEIKNSIFIKAKNDDNKNDNIKNIQIKIPLRNDILRRDIKEEDLEPYF